MGKTSKKNQYRSDIDHSKKRKAEKIEKESKNDDDYEPWDDIDSDDDKNILEAYKDNVSGNNDE